MMTETKRVDVTVLPYDYEGLEEQLNRLSEEGWCLQKPGMFSWQFQKCEPARYRYCVTCIPDGSEYRPEFTDSQKQLTEYCEEAGWQWQAQWEQMQIYRTEQPDVPSIDTDEAIKLETIRRAVHRKFLPSHILWFVLFGFSTVSFAVKWFRDPAAFLADPGKWGLMLIFAVCALIQMIELGCYLAWSRQSGQSVAEGGACADCRTIRRIQRGCDMGVIAASVVFGLSVIMNGVNLYYYVFLWIFCFLEVLIQYPLRKLLRLAGASRPVNMVLSVVCSLALSWILTLIIVAGLVYRGIVVLP